MNSKNRHQIVSTRARNQNRIAFGRVAGGVLALVISQPMVMAGNTWDGGAGTGNWGDANNWSPDGAPAYGTLVFSGNTQTTTNNNSVISMNQVNWNGSAAWVMNGSVTLSLYDNGGTQAKLESLGTGGVTINANITFAANNGSPPNPFGEINAVGSDIAFTGGTLSVNGSSVNGIKFFGGNGRDVSFANTVSASGKWFGFTNANSQSVTIAAGANVTTGDFYVMNGGTLRLAGGTLTTSAVRLGGDFGTTGNQNQSLGGTLALVPLTGGVSFASTINTVAGNTSNALLVDSRNTSGTNTLTSGIYLDSDLKIQQAAGGSLATSTGVFDIKNRKLTVDTAGTVTIGQDLTSSLGAGGSLLKQGSGILVLSGNSNNYTGTNSGTLNGNGTQIAAGTLAIAADTSLGLAPAGAYDNIQFTGSGTLRSDANLSLHANRNISIANGSTATFDTNGKNLTISGVVNGQGSLTKTGTGVLVLEGNNSYTGTTTINAGMLELHNSTSSIADTGAVVLADAAGAILHLQHDETIGSLSGGGATGGEVQLHGKHLTVGDANNTTYGGEITGAASSKLIKQGSGILLLSGTNTHTGDTEVNSGTLLMGDAVSDTFATRSVSVTSGATLGGSGTIAGSLAVSGNLSPGTSVGDIKNLAAGTTTWIGGSNVWKFDLGGSAGSSDKLAITGNFTKGTGSTFVFDFMGSVPSAYGNVYTLVTWSGSTNFAATAFSFQNLGGAFNVASNNFTITGNSLTFTAVPEPTSALAGLLVTAGLLRRRKAR